MNIKELFNKIDKEDVFLSYIRRYNIIEPYDHRFDVKDEVKIYKLFKKDLFEFIERVKASEIKNEKTDVLFVIDIIEGDFSDKQKKNYECFTLKQKDFLNINENTTIFFENNLNRYSFCFSNVEDINSINIAEESIKQYGMETVCAVICKEMQLFNFGKEEKEKEEFIESLENITYNEHECVDADVVFDELKKEIRKKLDKDTRKYFEEEEKFEKNVKDIKDKWYESVYKQNDETMMSFIKKELENYKK